MEEYGGAPNAVEESSGGESKIGGCKGDDCVVKEVETAAEVGEVRGVEKVRPATADEGERRKGSGWETGEEI